MHKFLRAVGFSKITKEELETLFQKIIDHPTVQKAAEDSEGNEFAELSKEYGDFFGISLYSCVDRRVPKNQMETGCDLYSVSD